MHATKQRLIEQGLGLLLEQGYTALGLQAILAAAQVPKGSFYHHFRDKEDFALEVLDAYMTAVHRLLDACVADRTRPPLDRIRRFFTEVQGSYQQEGYLGCLIGGLGQELSGVSAVFAAKIDSCLGAIADGLATCLEAAKAEGTLSADADPRAMADLIVDCWEGAALRSRLRRDPAPLATMLDFCLGALVDRQGPHVVRQS
jgi:TetR/AcrR family transcriptional repressor of nem operon